MKDIEYSLNCVSALAPYVLVLRCIEFSDEFLCSVECLLEVNGCNVLFFVQTDGYRQFGSVWYGKDNEIRYACDAYSYTPIYCQISCSAYITHTVSCFVNLTGFSVDLSLAILLIFCSLMSVYINIGLTEVGFRVTESRAIFLVHLSTRAFLKYCVSVVVIQPSNFLAEQISVWKRNVCITVNVSEVHFFRMTVILKWFPMLAESDWRWDLP